MCVLQKKDHAITLISYCRIDFYPGQHALASKTILVLELNYIITLKEGSLCHLICWAKI